MHAISSRTRWWTGGALFGAAVLLAGAARGRAMAPAHWAGAENGAWVTLFVDGQKATGALRANLPRAYVEVELSGSGAGSRYAGTLQGTSRRGEQATPLSGSWEATLAGSAAAVRFNLAAPGVPPLSRALAVEPSDGYPLLRCSWLRGSATRRPAAGTAALPLRSGDRLQLGDTVETGPASGAILVLGDSSVVLMQEKTRVTVPDVPDNHERIQSVKAPRGKVWFAVRKVQERGKFEVETDEAIAAVRGTEFAVEVTDQGDTTLTTAEGEVQVTDAGRQQPPVPVVAGSQWQLPGKGKRGVGPGIWRAVRTLQAERLREYVAGWRPMLNEADQHWPFRREGKARFWMGAFIDGAGPILPRPNPRLGAPEGHGAPPRAGMQRPPGTRGAGGGQPPASRPRLQGQGAKPPLSRPAGPGTRGAGGGRFRSGAQPRPQQRRRPSGG